MIFSNQVSQTGSWPSHLNQPYQQALASAKLLHDLLPLPMMNASLARPSGHRRPRLYRYQQLEESLGCLVDRTVCKGRVDWNELYWLGDILHYAHLLRWCVCAPIFTCPKWPSSSSISPVANFVEARNAQRENKRNGINLVVIWVRRRNYGEITTLFWVFLFIYTYGNIFWSMNFSSSPQHDDDSRNCEQEGGCYFLSCSVLLTESNGGTLTWSYAGGSSQFPKYVDIYIYMSSWCHICDGFIHYSVLLIQQFLCP
jgi:hypothetical protein